MNSIYYQITSSGYKRTDRQPPKGVDITRQLPVYRTVNEFMDLPTKQQTRDKNKVEEKLLEEGVNSIKDHSQSQQQYKNVKFVTFSAAKQNKEDETNSIKTDDFGSQFRKPEKSLTVYQNYQKLTVVPNASRAYTREYTPDAKTEKSTLNLQEHEHSNLYYELQKQRTLRQNLEKSYRSLLQKIEKNENSSKQDEQGWNFEQLGRKQKRHATQQAMTERVNKSEFQQFGQSSNLQTKHQKNKQMRSSCCDFNQKQAEDETKNQDLQLQEEHLHLVSQNEILQNRIQEDMEFLKNKLIQVENKMLQIQLHQKEQEFESIQKEVSNYSFAHHVEHQKVITSSRIHEHMEDKSTLSNKQRIHYLFTILIMFLCMVLMSKK